MFFALSWADPADSFNIGRFRLYRKGKLICKARVRKLTVSGVGARPS